MTRRRLDYDGAIQRAAKLVRQREKLPAFLRRVIRRGQTNSENLLPYWETLQIFIRMVSAWLRGRYTPSAVALISVVAALVYFLAPFDLIPDSIPVVGLMDDGAVILLVARLNLSEISRFRHWEHCSLGSAQCMTKS